MRIYITTLGRLRDQKTLMNLPPALRLSVVLVVQDHEYRAHADRYGSLVREVRALPPEVRTLGPTRRAVHGWAEDRKICMLDDDLDFYVRVNPADWHLTTPDEDTLEGMFQEVAQKLDDYAHVGVSGREGNNRVPHYGVVNTRYMRLLSYRTDAPFHPADVVHGRIDGMSDFDVNLQMLRRGRASYVFYRYAQGQSGTQTPGGCALNRTLATHEAEVDFMVREHAPHVRKRLKQNKGGGEFGTRPEVTIMWKDAYEEGATRHGQRQAAE